MSVNSSMASLNLRASIYRNTVSEDVSAGSQLQPAGRCTSPIPSSRQAVRPPPMHAVMSSQMASQQFAGSKTTSRQQQYGPPGTVAPVGLPLGSQASSTGSVDDADQHAKHKQGGGLFKKKAGGRPSATDVVGALSAGDQLGPLQRGMAKLTGLAEMPTVPSAAPAPAAQFDYSKLNVNLPDHNPRAAPSPINAPSVLEAVPAATSATVMLPVQQLRQLPDPKITHRPSADTAALQSAGASQLLASPMIHVSRVSETMRAMELGEGPLARAMIKTRAGWVKQQFIVLCIYNPVRTHHSIISATCFVVALHLVAPVRSTHQLVAVFCVCPAGVPAQVLWSRQSKCMPALLPPLTHAYHSLCTASRLLQHLLYLLPDQVKSLSQRAYYQHPPHSPRGCHQQPTALGHLRQHSQMLQPLPPSPRHASFLPCLSF